MNRHLCLDQAIAITKEFAGNDVPKDSTAIVAVLKNTYNVLKELSEDVKKE